MPSFIERGPSDCWPWQDNPEAAPNKANKMACNNPICCNPRHVVGKIEQPKRRGRPPKNELQRNSLVS
jgi:hypothetical protein